MSFTWERERSASLEYRDGRTVRTYQMRGVYTAAQVNTPLSFVLGQLPVIGTQFSGDPEARLASVEVRQGPTSHRGKFIFDCELHYTTDHPPSDNPLTDPAEIEWTTEQKQQWLTRDVDGKAIVNSAGDPFLDPPVECTRTVYRLTIKKNLAGPWPWLFSHVNGVNAEDWAVDEVIVPAGTARLVSVQVGPVQSRDGLSGGERLAIAYRPHIFTVEIDPQGHQIKVADRGLYLVYEKGGGQKERQKITDKDGTPCSSPQFLDGHGGLLQSPAPDNVVWLSFKAYKEVDFSVIPAE